jgi:hypothetical protein
MKTFLSCSGVDRVVAEALQQHEWRGIQSHQEVDDLGMLKPPATSMAVE